MNTVNSVAAGKEQYVSVEEVYRLSQTMNKEYRWKHSFQCKLYMIAADN